MPDSTPTYDTPTSIAEARLLRTDLAQRASETQAAIAALNEQKPPRHQTENYSHWAARRGRHIDTQRRIVAHLRFVKDWLHNAEQAALPPCGSISRVLSEAATKVCQFERLYAAVSDFLETDSDNAYEVLRQEHARLAGEYTHEPASNGRTS